jgi:hypothetical protein
MMFIKIDVHNSMKMIFLGCEDTITLGLINYVLLKIMKLVYFFLPIHQRRLKYLTM